MMLRFSGTSAAFVMAFFGWVALALPGTACPWCATNPAMKPTVEAGAPDPGGRFFGKEPDPARVRRYYVAAEPELWDFLPEGRDTVLGKPIPPHIASRPQAAKKRYYQYTDETFSTRVLPTERLGIMGPVLRGVVGDYIVVTLLNRLSSPVSMHPHGVRYDKDSEGSGYLNSPGKGASIAPQAKFTYVWHLDDASGPQPDEPSSKPWLYHSHVAGDEEINAGLSGFIIVTDPARARPDGTPVDVDREMALLLENYDESEISESEEYAKAPNPGSSASAIPPIPPLPWAELQERKEMAMRHALNGRIFGNLKGLEMVNGERVRWYLFALGIDPDPHTVHWHGERLRDAGGRHVDVIELMPGTMKSADMLASNPGDWMIHCHVGDHMMEGMFGKFTVHPDAGSLPKSEPFFGLGTTGNSVKWLEARCVRAADHFNFTARCQVSAYANLALWNTRVGISLDKLDIRTVLAENGSASQDGASFKVMNGDSLGIVRSDFIELEINLSGPGWAAAINDRLGDHDEIVLPLEVFVDETSHAAGLPLKITKESAAFPP